ncbi:MAG: hypothetical protein KAS77_10955, partial [Thermoplasmata archaeon]|nr:hypothetical protein [Thermoplasmata archaeon]
AGRVTSVPSGWTLVAFNKETNRYTVIKKENTTSGGKAITFPYDIRYLTVRGYYFLDQLLNWTLGEKVDGPINATSGNVVLVINSDDWTLSTREDKLKTLLETWGYDIQRIRIKDVPRFNATNATAVVVPAYYTSYGDQGYFWDKFMDQGVPVILLRNALQTYRTSNRVLGHTDYQYSIVISDSWFVTGYNGTRFHRQYTERSYAFYNTGPTGWTPLGHVNGRTTYYNMFYTQTPSGTLGFADMSDPLYYNPDGEFLLYRMLTNATGTAMPGEPTVPAGNVVLLIGGGTGTSGPTLTAQESALADLLTSWGHTLYYLSQRNISRTNVSAAKAVVATHWLDTNVNSKTFYDTVLAQGIGVVLCYDAGRTYGGSWYYSNYWDYRYSRVSNITTIFEQHPSLNFYHQDSGTATRVYSVCAGWTRAASSGNTGYSNWQQKPGVNGSYAFMIGNNPVNINMNGQYFLERAVNYSMGVDIPSVSMVPADDVVFITTGADQNGTVVNIHEIPVIDELIRWGYNITYVYQRDVLTLNLTNATMVVAADWISSFRSWANVLDDAVDDNIGVVLLYRGSSAYQTSLPGYDTWERRRLYVESPTAFLEGMSGYWFYAQDAGAGHYWSGTASGFTRI